jgi:plastocyanin
VSVRIPAAACVAAGALLVLPGLAQAKTKSVSLGPPPAASKQIQKAGPVDVNDFFPHGITIRAGDKVKFAPNGFHNVDIPAKGDDPTPLLAPTGENATGVNDAAGSPFWFNGQPNVSFNPVLLQSAFGKKVSYNGKKGVQSGLPLAAKPKPLTVTFKKKGKYTYYCDVHAGMKGVVTVKGKKAKVPSKKADKKALKKQVARSVKTAKGLASAKPPANTVDLGVAGKHGEEYFDFVPKTLTVPTGTTVNFRMSANSYEVHTATTGPGDPGDAKTPSYLRDIAATFEGAPTIDPRGVYPSEAPGNAAATLTPTLHGNGFWNSGVLDALSATPQLAGSNSVTFGAPGKYDFYCLVHPFMKGTVTVQ